MLNVDMECWMLIVQLNGQICETSLFEG